MKNKKLMWALIVLVVIATGYGIWRWKKAPAITYNEFTVGTGDITIAILSTGTVQPENRLEIKAPVAGRIDRVLIKEGQKVVKGQILAWMSSTERAALLDAARARGAEEVTRWEDIYKSTPIMSPLPGTVILKSVEPGQTITATDAIFAISDRLTVKAQVDETDIAKIKLHQKATISLDSYPDQTIPAVVDQIAYEAKPVNNVTSYVVDVLPEKAPDYFRSGMTANVRFFQDAKTEILTVSAEAITVADGKNKVLVKKPDAPPEEREIQIGISDGKKTEITSGLEKGDIVLRAQPVKGDAASSNNPFSPFGGGRSKIGNSKRK